MNRIIICGLIILACAAACKKNTPPPPEPPKPTKPTEPAKWYGRIKCIVNHTKGQTSTDTVFYYYDDQGRFHKQIDGYGTSELRYEGNRIYVKRSNQPSEGIYYMRDDWQIDSIIGPSGISKIYTYNQHGILMGDTSISYPGRKPHLVYGYNWEDGNTVSYCNWNNFTPTSDTGVKVKMSFDLTRLNTIEPHPLARKNKNLKTYYECTYAANIKDCHWYRYTFDSTGAVTEMVDSSEWTNTKTVTIYNYIYE